MQYKAAITTKEKAFCHLLLFFSLYEDETFEGEETYQVFSILKAYPLTAAVDFPEEVNQFFDYKNNIGNVAAYLQYLVGFAEAEYSLLLLFHAAQVAMSDTVFSDNDSQTLAMLRAALHISQEEGNSIIELAMAERNLKLKGR